MVLGQYGFEPEDDRITRPANPQDIAVLEVYMFEPLELGVGPRRGHRRQDSRGAAAPVTGTPAAGFFNTLDGL